MTGERVLPNLGLTNRWTVGTSGWGPKMDSDIAMLDALLFLTVNSATTDVASITSPAQGDRYVIPAGATGAWAGSDNRVAIYLDTAWEILTPKLGWRAFVVDTSGEVRFNGATWTVLTQPYDIQIWRYRMPWASVEPIVSLALPRAVTFPLGFSGSRASCKVASSTTQTLNVFRNATNIGSVNFAAGATSGTFTLAAAVTYATGDVFEVYPSATPDPALGGVRIVFAGNR